MKRLLTLLIILMGAAAWGNTYYVSNTGSNSNNGLSPDSAWLTLGYSCSQLSAGDTLFIMDGTYAEYNIQNRGTHSGTHDYGTLVNIPDGTAGNEIVFKGYQSIPVITSYGSDYAYYGIETWENEYLVFDSLEVKKTYRGITNFDGCSYITIKNCIIDSTGDVGLNNNNAGIITLGAPSISNHMTIQGCTIFHNREAPELLSVNSAAILWYTTDSSTITDNIIYDQPTSWGAIFLKAWNTHNEISNNTIHDASRGIQLYYGADSNTVHHNVIYDCTGGGIELHTGNDTPPARSNTGNQIYNNTFYSCASQGINLAYASGETVTMVNPQAWNNIIVQSTYAVNRSSNTTVTGAYFDYNCYYNSGSSIVASWLGTTYTLSNFVDSIHLDSNSVNVDPIFANAVGHDFRLTADSPQVLKTGGRAGVWPVYMGAYEYEAEETSISQVLSEVDKDSVGIDVSNNYTLVNTAVDTSVFYISIDTFTTVLDSTIYVSPSDPKTHSFEGLDYITNYQMMVVSWDESAGVTDTSNVLTITTEAAVAKKHHCGKWRN